MLDLTITTAHLSTITDFATQIFEDTHALWFLAIGLPLGFWLVRQVIGLVRTK